MSIVLRKAIVHQLGLLDQVLQQISDEQYKRKLKVLSFNSIGQHTRHIIEFFEVLDLGYTTGIVNYSNRKRDLRIETSKSYGLGKLLDVGRGLRKLNKSLLLISEMSSGSGTCFEIKTNYHRELQYNLDHTIHHMALLQIGAKEISGITIPRYFGVSDSTIKFRQQCAQ